ncbi:hypothetical protein GQ53DRAFT_614883, partial [Thozetella sp. PMI_491]
MVRTTIACARCRKLKIKCLHEGIAPCRNCQKKGSATSEVCILAGPELKGRNSLRAGTPKSTSRDVPRLDHAVLCSAKDISAPPGEEVLFSSIDLSLVLLACSIFSRKFPELRFLHLPSFSRKARIAWGDERAPGQAKVRLLCAAVVSLCTPLPEHEVPLERLLAYIRASLSVIDYPDLMTIQTLVVLSMYEWGAGSGYRAWMYSGLATRMMQSLLVLTKPASLTEAERQSHNRTLWSCFVLDRLVFCGRAQPFALSISSLHTHWPIGEQDFAFSQVSHALHDTGEEQGPLEYMEGDMDHYYGVLVRGFDIWARILKFIVSGGRRQHGLCLPENHPWVEGSPWGLLYRELQSWRECKDTRLRYPDVTVEGHAALGQAEEFGYINLVYYVSLLFLGREYIPFLPTIESEPSGPVDPPLLPLEPPPGWWAERANELFAASANITLLLHELESADAVLQTPFAGFCSFSAATMNLYVLFFPRMNLGRSENLPSILAMNLQYLDHFRKVRLMGEGWWVTIQHCQALYEHASQDSQLFHGRTRADFAALEYSIHNS